MVQAKSPGPEPELWGQGERTSCGKGVGLRQNEVTVLQGLSRLINKAINIQDLRYFSQMWLHKHHDEL